MGARVRTTYAVVLGQTLMVLRKRLHMDQNELALEVGTSRSTWSRIENGAAAISIDQLIGAAKHMGTTPSLILVLVEATKAEAHQRGISVLDKAQWPPSVDDLSYKSVRTLVEKVLEAQEAPKSPP